MYQLRYTHVDDVQYPAFVKMIEYMPRLSHENDIHVLSTCHHLISCSTMYIKYILCIVICIF